MKKTLALLLIAVILVGSCRKDSMLNDPSSSDLTLKGQNLPKVTIANTALSNWFVKNPMGQYLTVDWTKAKQTSIGNVAIVTVPLINISMPNSSVGKKTNDLSASTNTPLTAFDPYHPPALYFFQDKTSSTPDSVKALMMNFIPDDPKKEDGARKIWTGKLLEWDMQSKIAYYHHLSKSKVDGRSYINLSSSSANNSTSSKSVNSVGSKQTNTIASFFSDIWEAIEVFFSDIAVALNIPGYYPFTTGGADVVYPCDFLWGLFCGGGSGSPSPSASSSTTDDEGNTYDFVYSGYIDGYDDYSAQQATTWSLYINGSGGSNSNPCPDDESVAKKAVQQLSGGGNCDPNGNTTYVITQAMVINAAAVQYQLTSDQQYWLNNNTGIFNAIAAFINSDNNLGLNYYDAMDYWNFAIWEMSQNGMSISDFQNQYMTTEISMNDIDTYSGDEDDPNDNNSVTSHIDDDYLPVIFNSSDGPVFMDFGVTSSDNMSAYQKVNPALAALLVSAIEVYAIMRQSDPNLPQLHTIYIKATTNGAHVANSNHYINLAMDISRINGVPVIKLGAAPQVIALQQAFDMAGGCRENFGPYFKHKNGVTVSTNDGVDHLHISVNPQN